LAVQIIYIRYFSFTQFFKSVVNCCPIHQSEIDHLKSQSKEDWSEETTNSGKERSESDEKSVDEVANVGDESWELDSEERLKSDVDLAKGEGDEDRLESWVQLLDEGSEELGEDNWLSVELAENIVWEVAQVLASLYGWLGGLDLRVGGLEGGGDALNVLDDRGGSALLLVLAGVGWDGAGDRVHVGGESLDLGGQAGDHVSQRAARAGLGDLVASSSWCCGREDGESRESEE